MGKQPLVSVCMITYGHELFIEKAIEGILMQTANFEIELIIADDASPDNTAQFVQKHCSSHPNGSWANYTKHQINKGMMANFSWALQECKGKYIALCEGDDYWTDPLKLQKQVDFLEANPDFALCFSKVQILKPNGELVNDYITNPPNEVTTQADLAEYGNYIHTPSVLFKNCITRFPDFFGKLPVGDYPLYILITHYGKIKYFPQVMAVYRHGVGFWSLMQNMDMRVKWLLMLELLTKEYKKDISLFLKFRKQYENMGRKIVTQLIDMKQEDTMIERSMYHTYLFRRIKFYYVLKEAFLRTRNSHGLSVRQFFSIFFFRIFTKIG